MPVDHEQEVIRICSYCKKIWIDEQWIPIEEWLKQVAPQVKLTHGICNTCKDDIHTNPQ